MTIEGTTGETNVPSQSVEEYIPPLIRCDLGLLDTYDGQSAHHIAIRDTDPGHESVLHIMRHHIAGVARTRKWSGGQVWWAITTRGKFECVATFQWHRRLPTFIYYKSRSERAEEERALAVQLNLAKEKAYALLRQHQ